MLRRIITPAALTKKFPKAKFQLLPKWLNFPARLAYDGRLLNPNLHWGMNVDKCKMIFLFPLLTVMMSLTTASIPLARGQEFRPAGRPIPVILDTDIGDDIDDTWALGFLLKCPELDLKLVVGDAGKPQYRAHLLAKFLQTAGRSDVAIGVGLDVKPKGEGGQSEWIKGYELRTYPGKVHADGVQAIIDTIMNSKEPVKAAMEWKNLEGFRDLLADRLTGRPSKKLPGPRNGS